MKFCVGNSNGKIQEGLASLASRGEPEKVPVHLAAASLIRRGYRC